MVHIENIVRKFGPIAAVLAIIFAVFFRSLFVGYFADDFDFVVRMPKIPLIQLVTRSTDGTIGGGSWRPLTMIIYGLSMSEHQSAFFNHAVSIALYLILLGILYACVRELFPERSDYFAAVVVLLVGLMPIHAEPVVWVAARADLIAAVAGLAALWAWLCGYGKAAVVLLLLSLCAKEFWLLFAPVLFFLGPSDFSRRDRMKYGIYFFVGTAVWFAVRYFVTRYGVGGYSITQAQHVWGIQHLTGEVISFVVGSWNFGVFQSWIIRFSQYYWFIVSWLVAVGLGVLASISWNHPRSRFLFAAVVCLQLPTLILSVSYIRPGPSVGEHRYWFAGSIFLVLLGAHFIKKWQKTVAVFVAAVFFLGITFNISLYQGAAEYRDMVLSGWKSLDNRDASLKKVAFLPDSWYGVHLLASPFFERVLENENLPKPRSVSTWYQQCDKQCLTPASVQQGLHGLVRLFAQDPRIFSQTSHGLRYDATEQLEQGTTLAIWSGTTWIELSSEVGENRSQ